MRSTVHYILPCDGAERVPEPDYSSLLRDQEAAAFSHAMKQTPPPSYQDIMDDQPPPYPASVQVIIDNPPEGPGGGEAAVEGVASTSTAALGETVAKEEGDGEGKKGEEHAGEPQQQK